MKQIIHVRGIPGSGKTYICKMLKNVICVDMDDYMKQAYINLKTQKKQINQKNFSKEVEKLFELLFEKNGIIIIVGITIRLSPALEKKIDHRFVITMTNSELETAYKRLVMREIQKYKKLLEPAIQKKLEQLDSQELWESLNYEYAINAINIGEMNLAAYKKMYKEELQYDKEDGYYVGSQARIVAAIKKIISKN